jgi:WhiB family transcriptional regulator, redox-sensing transcriptional regulator
MGRLYQSNAGESQRVTELDDSWMEDAACQGKDTNDFFEFPSNNPIVAQDMKNFCVNACKVRDRCLLWALYVPEQYGIWGGMDADERRALRRREDVRQLLRPALLDTAV